MTIIIASGMMKMRPKIFYADFPILNGYIKEVSVTNFQKDNNAEALFKYYTRKTCRPLANAIVNEIINFM